VILFPHLKELLGFRVRDQLINCRYHLDKYYMRILNFQNIEFSEEEQRIKCTAHILSLACQDAISVLKMQSLNLDDDDNDSDDDVDASLVWMSQVMMRIFLLGACPFTTRYYNLCWLNNYRIKKWTFLQLRFGISKIRKSN
jgi:hypothetical protein